MEETLMNRSSIAAPLIFLIVVVLQLIPIFLDRLKKRELFNDEQIQLRQQIKELLKEASSLSKPSTFAQAAKLKRMAAAKEKELLRSQELYNKKKNLSYEAYLKALKILKVVTYLLLILWFWRDPVAAISQHLLQPFGKILSWRAVDPASGLVMVGIIPWLIISNRVGKFICQKVTK